MKKTVFIKSLKKIKPTILLMMLIDAIPYILAFFGIILILKSLSNIALNLNLPGNLYSLSLEEAEALLSKLRVFYYSIFAYPLLLTAALIAAWSFSKGFIYSMILNKKFKLKYYLRFLLLNFVWAVPWLLFIFIMLRIIKPEALIFVYIAIILLWLHFTVILYVLFTQENKLNKILKALKIGVKKIHLFILPYLAVLGLFILFLLLLFVYGLLPQALSLIFTIATFLFFIAVSRIYLADIIQIISKKEV